MKESHCETKIKCVICNAIVIAAVILFLLGHKLWQKRYKRIARPEVREKRKRGDCPNLFLKEKRLFYDDFFADLLIFYIESSQITTFWKTGNINSGLIFCFAENSAFKISNYKAEALGFTV